MYRRKPCHKQDRRGAVVLLAAFLMVAMLVMIGFALDMGYLLVAKFVLGQHIGQRPMLFVSILFLVASVQFLTTGVLAELLTRTFYASSPQSHHRIRWESDAQAADWKTPA